MELSTSARFVRSALARSDDHSLVSSVRPAPDRARPGGTCEKGPTRVGRPLLPCLVWKVGFGEFWRVPVDEGLVVLFMPRLDVADRVAALAEGEVVVVGVKVRDDDSVAELRSWRSSLSASARLLMGSGNAGLRDGSTSAQGGPEPRAAARRAHAAEHGEHGEDRTERPH